MQWLILIAAVIGLSTDNVILINHTGLKIVRIQIGDRKLEEVNTKVEQFLVVVTPEKHDMRLTFKGGAHIDWPDFDFKGIHQIIFERVKNKINAHFE